MDQLENRFVITSGGCAASRWIGATLSQHPDIFCSAGAGEFDDMVTFGNAYSAEIAERVAKANIDFFAGKDAQTKSPRELFAELERCAPYKTYLGNVHFYTVEILSDFLRGENSPVPVVNVIRHPVTRLDAFYRNWSRFYDYGPFNQQLFELSWSGYQTRFGELLREIQVEIPDLVDDLKKRMFMFSVCDCLSVFLGDFGQRGPLAQIRHFKMEDLKARPESMRELVLEVTSGKLRIADEFLARVYTPESLNAERFSQVALKQPSEVFAGWDEWQRQIFQIAMIKSGWDRPYRALGYSFTGIGDSSQSTALLSFHPPPKLIEEGHYGFNIVRYNSKFWAIQQSLGTVDLIELARNGLSADLQNRIFFADDILTVKHQVAALMSPSILENPLVIAKNLHTSFIPKRRTGLFDRVCESIIQLVQNMRRLKERIRIKISKNRTYLPSNK